MKGIRVGEGSVSYSSSPKEITKRKPVPLTQEILLLLEKQELDKGKWAKLLTMNLTCQGGLLSTKEELIQQQEKKAQWELERQQAAEEKSKLTAAAEQ